MSNTFLCCKPLTAAPSWAWPPAGGCRQRGKSFSIDPSVVSGYSRVDSSCSRTGTLGRFQAASFASASAPPRANRNPGYDPKTYRRIMLHSHQFAVYGYLQRYLRRYRYQLAPVPSVLVFTVQYWYPGTWTHRTQSVPGVSGTGTRKLHPRRS